MESRSLYLFYRSLGSGKFQSIFSVFLKPILHYVLYRKQELFPFIFKRYISKFNYDKDGFWTSLHIGIQHFRPLLTGTNVFYLKGNEKEKLTVITKKFNVFSKLIFLDKYKNEYLNFIKFIKDKDKVLLTCDGKLGSKNEFILIKNYKFYFSSNLIELAFYLKKECYFEIYYLNNFFKIKRIYVKLNRTNYKVQIQEIISFLAVCYPHNLRKNRLIIDN